MTNTQFFRESQQVDLSSAGNIRLSNLTGYRSTDIYAIPVQEFDEVEAIEDAHDKQAVMLTYAIGSGQTRKLDSGKYQLILPAGTVAFAAYRGIARKPKRQEPEPQKQDAE